jgi:prepilin-type N-terminal cleavage/methylation domain-containing protein
MICRTRRPSGPNKGPRAAYSLIEMIVVISISVVILSLMYVAIVGVVKRTSEPDNVDARFGSLSVASARLRKDLRLVDTVKISDDGHQIESAGQGGSTIVWKIVDRPFRLERIDPGSKEPAIFGLNGFRAGRFERFEIPSGAAALVRLTVETERSRRTNVLAAGTPKPFSMEFALRTAKPAPTEPGEATKEAKP